MHQSCTARSLSFVFSGIVLAEFCIFQSRWPVGAVGVTALLCAWGNRRTSAGPRSELFDWVQG